MLRNEGYGIKRLDRFDIISSFLFVFLAMDVGVGYLAVVLRHMG